MSEHDNPSETAAPGGQLGQRSRWCEADGREAVVAWRQSGLSQSAWCRQSGVALHRLQYWIGRVERLDAPAADDPVGFVMLDPPVSPSAEATSVWVAVDDGRPRVMVRAGFDGELLRAVVAALTGEAARAGAWR